MNSRDFLQIDVLFKYTVLYTLQQYDGGGNTAVSRSPIYYVFIINFSDNMLIKTNLKCKVIPYSLLFVFFNLPYMADIFIAL